jgi:hypothetical protein
MSSEATIKVTIDRNNCLSLEIAGEPGTPAKLFAQAMTEQVEDVFRLMDLPVNATKGSDE